MTTDHEPALAVLEPQDDAFPEPAAADVAPALPTADADNRHVYVHALSWLVAARRRAQP